MSEPASPAVSGADVAVLLVSHDGARWLPAVIEGLRAQTVRPGAVVAVDTTSRDETPRLLAEAFGEVVSAPGSTSFPAAVALGLERLAALPDPPAWVWVLHDDTNPDPDALRCLLDAARSHPDADLLGPKLREWPSLRRLLEVGVTISGTGRRELGLERGEYDQGQHDEVREVLAVNTAGLLVRRQVLVDLGGLDEQLPIFGNDVDLGWRAVAAGHTVLVVPSAVVFHAEAAHRGVRRTPLTGRHTHYQERRAALYTLLANCRGRALPFQVVRLAFGTLLRMLGLFLVRAPGEALDDLAALVSVYAKPGQVRAARRARRATRSPDPAVADRVRRLLAPRWLPYRHGLDFLGDLLSALTVQAADVAERRRAAAVERDPSSMAARRVGDRSDLDAPDEDEDYTDTSAVARFVTNPVAVLLALLVVALLLVARPALGAVTAAGLPPVPDAVGEWWRLHGESWHALGTGTDVPAPAYVLPLALLGSVLGTQLAVSSLMVLAAPLALWGAWRFLRVVGRFVSPLGAPRWLLLAGAAAYALVPLVSGLWGQGRLGLVVLTALLPWLAHAALGFADPSADRRWRAAWRAGFLLALATAFAPVAWALALAVGLVVVAAVAVLAPSAVRDRSTWGPPATAVAAVPLLLLPWWLPALLTGAGEALLLDTGRLPGPDVDRVALLTGRLADGGAPEWTGVVVVVLAVAALVPRATRVPVLVCWIVAAAVAAVAAGLSLLTLSLAASAEPAGLGAALVVVQAALVTAAVLGGLGAVRAGGWRWVPVAVGVAAAALPLAGLAWSAAAAGDGLSDGEDSDVPAYMVQASSDAPERGILVVRGEAATGLTYAVRRGEGVTVGEDEVLALAAEDEPLTAAVQELVSRPTPETVDAVADAGVQYVVLPAPADGVVASALDASGGLTQASAERGTRAWQVARDVEPDTVSGPRSWLRIGLLVVQGLAVVWVLVLCAPTARRSRS